MERLGVIPSNIQRLSCILRLAVFTMAWYKSGYIPATYYRWDAPMDMYPFQGAVAGITPNRLML